MEPNPGGQGRGPPARLLLELSLPVKQAQQLMAAAWQGHDPLVTVYEQILPFPGSRQIIDFSGI